MRNFMIAGGLTLAMGIAASASAQYPAPAPVTANNIAIRAGVVLPIDSNMRDVSNTWLGAGADYYFPTQLIKGSETYLSADWLGRSANGIHGNIFPICLNQKFPLANTYKGYSAYAFAGLGAYIIDVQSSNTTFGVRGGIGVDLGPNIFAEATGYLSDARGGSRCTAVGIYIGYRF